MLKFHTLYVTKSVIFRKRIYAILNSYGLENRLCFSTIQQSELGVKIKHAIDILSSEISDSIEVGKLGDSILGAISKEKGGYGLEWTLEISDGIWMSEEDFLSNFEEVVDEEKLHSSYRDLLSFMRD